VVHQHGGHRSEQDDRYNTATPRASDRARRDEEQPPREGNAAGIDEDADEDGRVGVDLQPA
jgi:hypothetical protein